MIPIPDIMDRVVTEILDRSDFSERQSSGELLQILYEELRQLAAAKMARESPGQTIQATALVHEAFLKLVDPEKSADKQWNGRAHFFGAAAEAMRRILVDRARAKACPKRGGQVQRTEADSAIAAPGPDEKILMVNDALEQLAASDEDLAKVVKLRFFVGMTHAEIAGLLEVSEKTVNRYWSAAKILLFHKIKA